MKARNQFWPLFKAAIRPDQYVAGFSFVASLWCGFTLLFVMPHLLVWLKPVPAIGVALNIFNVSPEHRTQVGVMVFPAGWMSLVSILTGFLMMERSFEFLFTRAIDRKVFFRVRTLAIFLAVVLVPGAINLGMASLPPAFVLQPDDPESTAAIDQQARFMQTFPDSHREDVRKSGHAERLVVPRGNAAFAGWVLWSAVAAFVLLQAYCAVICQWVARGAMRWRWPREWVWVIFFLPLPLAMSGVPPLCGWMGIDWMESSFLFLAGHPWPMALGLVAVGWAVYLFAERRFCGLEVAL